MTELFLRLLNVSITASWIVLAVLLLRLCLKKAPKWFCCLLWGIVALRLVMPFTLESVFSLIPSGEVIPQDIITAEAPAIYSGIPVVNNAVNPLFTTHLPPEENLLEKLLTLASLVWAAGTAVMLLYSAVTYWKLRWQVRVVVPCRKNVYICDDIATPFILGVFRPRIYIPSGMSEEHLQYVLAHENAHLKRLDHWWKPLSFMLLTVYWFNPLLWLAYILLCRDIEQACDEKVIAGMNNAQKKGYAQTLVSCSVHRRMIMSCPLAFGEIGVKARIKGVVRYKKPGFWILLASLAVCITAAVCFLTNPKSCSHTYHGKITVNATCTQRGIETHTCELCKHSYTTAVALRAHIYNEGTVTKAPSCTQQGTVERVCTACGKHTTEVMEKLPHIAGEPTFIQEANCTEKGARSATCTVCHGVYVAEVLETNDMHDMRETVLLAATCAAPGEGVRKCTRCEHSEVCTYGQLEHNFKTGIIIHGTCIAEGKTQQICTECGTKTWIKTPKLTTHKWLILSSLGEKRCDICGAVEEYQGAQRVWRTSDTSLWDYSGNKIKEPEDLLPVIRIWP